MPRRLVAASSFAALGCADPTAANEWKRERPLAPEIVATVVAANPHNALSALVKVRARHGDSAWVHVAAHDAAAADAVMAPAARLTSDTATVLVLGLHPERRYVVRVGVGGPGGVVLGEPLSFTSGPLPPDLPRYGAGGDDPSPGYVVFAAGRYGVVIDNGGRVVWYREFPWNVGLSFMAQPNGRFVLRPQTPDPGDLEPWLEVHPSGAVTRTLGCVGALQPRPHDLIAAPDGGYWIMCDETRVMDLGALGGAANAVVTGTAVQHVGADGTLRFQWSPFDHFALTDLDPALRSEPTVNWTHGNAIDLDPQVNLLVSFRNLSEITSIDTRTGNVRWRLGGRANKFTLPVGSTSMFAGQHGVRARADGSLLVFDNGGDPSESRSEHYHLDHVLQRARTIGSYGSATRALTTIGGSVQDLPGGRTLVSFGTAGRVEEYDASGRLTWEVFGHAGYVFRAQRIASLYAPGIGTAR